MFHVYINSEFHGMIEAPNYREAKRLARAMYGRRCDVIG